MRGNLKQFTQWCEGRANGVGRHYPALDALQRFQMYLKSKENEEMKPVIYDESTDHCPICNTD